MYIVRLWDSESDRPPLFLADQDRTTADPDQARCWPHLTAAFSTASLWVLAHRRGWWDVEVVEAAAGSIHYRITRFDPAAGLRKPPPEPTSPDTQRLSVLGHPAATSRHRYRFPGRDGIAEVDVVTLPEAAWRECREAEDRSWALARLGAGLVQVVRLAS